MKTDVLVPRAGFVTVLFDDLKCYHVVDASGAGGRAHGIHDYDKGWIESLLCEIKAEPLPDMKPGERVTLEAMEITDAAFIKRRTNK